MCTRRCALGGNQYSCSIIDIMHCDELSDDFQLICEEVMIADAPVIAINCRVEPPTSVVITCSIDGGDSFACMYVRMSVRCISQRILENI